MPHKYKSCPAHEQEPEIHGILRENRIALLTDVSWFVDVAWLSRFDNAGWPISECLNLSSFVKTY